MAIIVQQNLPENLGFFSLLKQENAKPRDIKIASLVISIPPTLCILSLEMANYFSLLINSPKKSPSAQRLVLTQAQ